MWSIIWVKYIKHSMNLKNTFLLITRTRGSSINWLTFYTSLNKFFTPVRDYPLMLYEIHFDILIKKITKIIKMWDLWLWSQLFYFLHMFDLVLHNVRDYHLPFEQISLDILIEVFTKIINNRDLRLCYQLLYFLLGLHLVLQVVRAITLFHWIISLWIIYLNIWYK
jgi:hypothetical protein